MNTPEDAEDWLWSRTSRDCWIWTGAVGSGGYGRVAFRGRQVHAHQAAFILTYGKPKGNVLHRCGIRLCVNPAHLYDGSAQENAADRDRHGRTARLAGAKNSQAKLTDEQVTAIRADTRSGSVAAPEYGISQSHYYRIKRGVAWQHLANATTKKRR